SLLETLIDTGINQGYFEEINIENYSKLLLYNIINVFIIENYPFGCFSYILMPLLTEKGKKILNVIDAERFFESKQ
ncbi:MAG: hypothetical protein LBK03_03515, partial [Bacteroidales bacterium]|nr:hypothetical protein [Bacteroidales bacterium]